MEKVGFKVLNKKTKYTQRLQSKGSKKIELEESKPKKGSHVARSRKKYQVLF
jgi:hypothetical protein